MSPSHPCMRKVIALSKKKLKHKKKYDYPLRKKLMVNVVMKKAGVALSSDMEAMKIKLRESHAALNAAMEARKLRQQGAGIKCHPTLKASTSDSQTVTQKKVTRSTEQQMVPATSRTRQSEDDNQETITMITHGNVLENSDSRSKTHIGH